MKAFYSDHFVLPLPPDHRFPMRVYSLLRERLLTENVLKPENLIVPDPATDEQILRCHDADYLERVKNGTLSHQEIRRIGFPWSPMTVERSRRSSGGTIGTCKYALQEGIAVNLAGGTHHACRDHGEGYCIFNDSAIAARTLQAEGLVRRIVVLDCDVHQGNGTASILADDPTIFTFSIHGAKNFPFRKSKSDLDIELEDGTGDRLYLDILEEGIGRALALSHADIAIYLAGADPFEGDRLGRLKMTKNGLLERDRLVLELCRAQGIPVAVTMAGGYARNPLDIVDIHFETVKLAAELWQQEN